MRVLFLGGTGNISSACVERALAWHDADPARQRVDGRVDATMDRIIAACQVGPAAGAHSP